MAPSSNVAERTLAAHPDDHGPLPDGIHRIAVPTPLPVGRINCYLLEGDPLTLVDCGPNIGTSLDALDATLQVLGHSLEAIERVVLTHEHPDHLGLAAVLQRRSDCSVAAYGPLGTLLDPDEGAREHAAARLEWALGQLQRHGYPTQLVMGMRSAARMFAAFGSRPRVDLALHEGDTLRAGGREWEVAHRPGHSLSDLLFIDRAAGVAIAGDHVLATTSPNPMLSAPLEILQPDERTERAPSLPLYIDSLVRTTADDLQLLLVGHGPTVGPPADLIADRIAFHHKRCAKIATMLSDEPLTVYEIANKLWRGIADQQPTLTLSEALGHLDLLGDEGTAVEVPLRDGIVGFAAS